MTTLATDDGRTNQKRRTRAAILAAAAELMRQGRSPTVTEAADAALVSRATAYRYFPTPEQLLTEAGVSISTAGEVERILELAASATVEERVDAVVRGDHAMTLAHEAAFRTFLRACLSPRDDEDPTQVPRRPGNRLRWFAEALRPARAALGEAAFRRLVAALSLCVGTESIVVTRDVCGLGPAEAEAVKRWAAAALLRVAFEEAGRQGAALPPGDGHGGPTDA